MKKYFINPDKKQYKANLHSHTFLSDGKLTPEQMKNAYKEKGYSILSITDHERPKNHSYLNDDDFLTITGYEAYVRPSEECIYDLYGPEIHINLFAKKPDNEAYICYNKAYCKYIKDLSEHDKLNKVGSTETRRYTAQYINKFIKTAVDNGYLVSYNHPVWSMEEEERVLSYENIFSLEIDNYGCFQTNATEYSGALYDKLLRKGRRWACHGGDDNHNIRPLDSVYSDSFGAFTMIMPEKFDYDGVIAAMEKGEMYSSTGPEIYEISIEGDTVHIESSAAKQIILYTGSKGPKFVIAPEGETITSADLKVDSRAEYFRICVVDEKARKASSRGFFKDEW